ncbi:MAG: metallophosphoesterase family protein [Gaiellales bacterium]
MSKLSRIGVIGDVHACDHRLELLLGFLHGQAIDRLVCVGDVVNGPGDANRCVELLRASGVETVRGNHDVWVAGANGRPPVAWAADLAVPGAPAPDTDTLDYLRQLPATLEFQASTGLDVLVCHGLRDNDMNTISSDDYGYALESNVDLQALLGDRRRRLVLKGHRHRPAVWEIDRLTLVDAGCLLDDTPSCGVIVDLEAAAVTPLAIVDGVVHALDAKPIG